VVAAWLTVALVFALRSSVTSDEVTYFGAGLSYLEYGDFRMNPEHPPLIKVLAMLPVYLLDRPEMGLGGIRKFGLDESLHPWPLGRSVPYGHYLLFLSDLKPPQGRLVLSRMVPMLIGLLGGVLACVVGRRLSGRRRVGLLAAVLLLFYPEYLGHSALLTFDVPQLVSCAAISWAALRWWRNPSPRETVLLTVVCCLGSLVKLPTIVFAVITVLTLFVLSLLTRRVSPWRVVAVSFLILAAGIFTAWAGSLFRFAHTPDRLLIEEPSPYLPPVEMEHPGVLIKTINFAWEHRLLPETTLSTMAHAAIWRKPGFLMGETAQEGFFSYFFVTYLLKSTPVQLVAVPLLIVAALLWWRGGSLTPRRAWRLQQAIILVVPTLLLLALTINARANIGHRYILFVYFPLSIFLAMVLKRWWRRGGKWRGAAAVLVGGHLLSFALAYPHFSTYFNFLTGSPYEARRMLSDSNTDWGQDLPELFRFLNANGYDQTNLALFGHNLPNSFGISTTRWIDDESGYPSLSSELQRRPPDPALPTAVSVNYLDRLARRYPELLDREPDAILNSIVVFLPQKETPGDNSAGEGTRP
jgi:hypothetical protein